MIFRRDSLVTSLLILINIIVYVMWIPSRYTPTTEFMARNFLVSWQALADGRWWVLLTSVFSHNWILHLFINMFVLNSFGRFLEQFFGWRFYLGFYLIAGLVSSLTHALVSAFFLGQPEMAALGASGAIAGLVILFSLTFPREKIVLFALIPVPALVGAVAFVALDLWGLYAQAGGGGLPIGHGAHLGGALTGLLTYILIVRPRLLRSRMLRNS